MNEISWKVETQIKGGPQFKLSDKMQVDAYDKIDVSVDSQAKKTVRVQPAHCRSEIRLLLIMLNLSDGEPTPLPDKCVTYTIEGGPEKVPLYHAHVVLGSGAAKLLQQSPMLITVCNPLDDPVDVTILVGRSAEVEIMAMDEEGGEESESENEPEPESKPEEPGDKPDVEQDSTEQQAPEAELDVEQDSTEQETPAQAGM